MPHFEGLPPLVPIHFWQKVTGLTPPLCSYIIRNVGSTPLLLNQLESGMWRVSGWKILGNIGIDWMLAFAPPFSGSVYFRIFSDHWLPHSQNCATDGTVWDESAKKSAELAQNPSPPFPAKDWFIHHHHRLCAWDQLISTKYIKAPPVVRGTPWYLAFEPLAIPCHSVDAFCRFMCRFWSG